MSDFILAVVLVAVNLTGFSALWYKLGLIESRVTENNHRLDRLERRDAVE